MPDEPQPQEPLKPPTGFGAPPRDLESKRAWYLPAAIVAVAVMFFNSDIATALADYMRAHVEAVSRIGALEDRVEALEQP